MTAIRSALFFIWMYGLMTVMGVPWLLSFFMPRIVVMKGIVWYTKLIRWGLRWIAGVTMELRGLENLPEGPIIYASKHQCMWDVLVPFLVLDDPAIIMKQSLLWFPGFGWFAVKADMIPIDRGGNIRTLKKMVAEAKKRADKGRQVLIFPEGTRVTPGEKGTYQAAGLSALYKSLNVPVVPVATNAGLCWQPRGLTKTPGLIVYELMPPIETGLKRKELMARVETAIETTTDALVAEGRAVQAELGVKPPAYLPAPEQE